VAANGNLYVATVDGTVYRLDVDSGTITWQTNITTGGAGISANFSADTNYKRLYVVDSSGKLHALLDACSEARPLWSSTLSGALAIGQPPIFFNGSVRKLFCGTENGRVYQLNVNTGAAESYATLTTNTTAFADVLITARPDGNPGRLLATAGGVLKKLCVPWVADGTDKAFLSAPDRTRMHVHPLTAVACASTGNSRGRNQIADHCMNRL
jgi:outer membrane protein assembly factor BamB